MKFSGFLSGRIKVIPDDFIVNEKINLSIQHIDSHQNINSKYYLFRLKKTNWNTSDILMRIAKDNKIKLSDIQYGGRKDRYGITTQYITSKYLLTLPEQYRNKVQLELLGITDKPMSAGSILENEFIITIRSIQEKEIHKIQENIEFVIQNGFINYFDSQRFSTFKQDTGIPAFYLLNQDFEHFIKFYLIHTLNAESKQAKDRKYSIEKIWGNWEECLRISKSNLEKNIFHYLIKNQNNKNVFKDCMRFIPPEELKFMISILQGFIWNISITKYLEHNVPSSDLLFFKSRIGPLVFLKNYTLLSLQEFPLIHKSVLNDERYKFYFEYVFNYIKNNYLYNDKKINLEFNFNNQKLAVDTRKIQIKPKNFEVLSIDVDDIYKNKRLMKLKFSLESGSYATMLIKRLLIRI